MDSRLVFFLACLLGVLALAGVFHILARLGGFGRAVCDWCARAPGLDVVVFAFTHGAWVAAGVVWWRITDRSWGQLGVYLGLAVLAQIVSLFLWSWGHELMHPEARKGPRIVSTLNRQVGRFRNHAAVWWTALAVPVFTLIRLAEFVVYPPLIWLVRLPRYKHRDWVNVSRQKFTGLVGYDLIWCLYCDWMTGVWSLGSEMLRNVESFWCPIRFSSPEKCANCKIDFPDVATDWVPPTPQGDMGQVADLLASRYPVGGGPGGVNSWFGHPVRLTVRGKDVKDGR
jgi:hypothetical protein